MKRLVIGSGLFLAGVVIAAVWDSRVSEHVTSDAHAFWTEFLRFGVFSVALYPCARYGYLRPYGVPSWRYVLMSLVASVAMGIIGAVTSPRPPSAAEFFITALTIAILLAVGRNNVVALGQPARQTTLILLSPAIASAPLCLARFPHACGTAPVHESFWNLLSLSVGTWSDRAAASSASLAAGRLYWPSGAGSETHRRSEELVWQ